MFGLFIVHFIVMYFGIIANVNPKVYPIDKKKVDEVVYPLNMKHIVIYTN